MSGVRSLVFGALLFTGVALHFERMVEPRPRPRPGASRPAPRPARGIDLATFQQLELLAKYALGVEGLLARSPGGARSTEQLRSQLRSELSKLSDRQTVRASTTRQLAILCATFGDTEQARRRFERAAELSGDADERELWRAIYGDPRLTEAQLPAMYEQIDRLGLGWYRPLVKEAAARKAGVRKKADDFHQMAQAEATMVAMAIFCFGFAALVIAALGFGLTVLALVLALSGRLRFGGLDATRISARPLFESWILFFFLMEAGSRIRWPPLPSLPLAPAFFTSLLAGGGFLYLIAHLRAEHGSVADLGLRCGRWWEEALWGVVGWLTMIPWAIGSAIVVFLLGRQWSPELTPPSHPIQQFVSQSPNPATLIMTFVLAVVVAPILEETFFRGILQGALRRRFGAWPAILGSAFVFAVLHPQLPLGLPPLFLLGAGFAVLYEMRGSLVPGMVAHALNNGLLMLMMFAILRR